MRLQLTVLALIGQFALIGSAAADMISGIEVVFELPWEQAQNLERAACLEPYNLRLHASYGSGTESDNQTKFSAYALCATHRYVENNPVAYEVDCDTTAGELKCTSAREVIAATFADRHVFIASENASLEQAYAVVAYFVAADAFEPGPLTDDVFDRIDGAFDECVVKGRGNETFDIDCQLFSARVKRDAPSGTSRYVQIPAR